MKKIIPLIVVGAIVIAAGSFFGGMTYGKTLGRGGDAGQQWRMGEGAGGQGWREAGGPSGSRVPGAVAARRSAGGGFVSGEIISKDDTSVTVKLGDGGSKIIFYSDSTEVGKFETGASADLEVGKTVVITGKTNADGSITAQSIQLRPEVPAVAPSTVPPQE